MQSKAVEGNLMYDAASILLQHIHARFPTTNEMICAAILDPSVQNSVAITEYLDEKGVTREDVVKAYARDNNICIDECDEVDNTCEIPEAEPPLKMHVMGNLKAYLLKRHAVVKNAPARSIASEIRKFREVEIDVNNEPPILNFWKMNEEKFPLLSKIAKVIFGQPVSTAKSETSFSTAGAVITAKRSRLDPMKVEKILFIHDNYNLMKL